METLKEFKNEFKIVCSDAWGECMGAWFECAAHLYHREIDIPTSWEYSPGIIATDARDDESYWFEIFNDTSDEMLLVIGNFLYCLSEILRAKGLDY